MIWYLEHADYFGCHLLSGRDWFPFYVSRVVGFYVNTTAAELIITEMGRQ